ncbi:MAG: glyoxalase [Candidatus Infernicultor aquiphilus]|uniref:Glyoxalase n=1 Tax=Candidatus Infernicultor aquiphilus TaxID=1805029 RepID=A0A1J5G4Q1_9BACT|nr:MAG: glyoxalase [Candidatus Atribacteria bacterium CG2_30_33_13]PIY31116.1 MAG: glyoxalase [Candidatus Atribacteria bacterium CG_4_10_14_3_um_filter_34_13]
MKFCWVTINVKDMEKSLHFYQEIIGLNINRRMKPNSDMEIIFLGSSETQIELIYNTKVDDIAIGKDISLGFVVDSIEQISEILKKKNIPIHSGPFQPNPSIKFIYILDPNGIKIQFIENIK